MEEQSVFSLLQVSSVAGLPRWPLIPEELSLPHILWLSYGILTTSLVKLPNSEQTMETKMAHTDEEGLLCQDQS